MDRTSWPYPSMHPYSVKMYPIVQTARAVGPQPLRAWPPRMAASLVDWRARFDDGCRSLNQIYLHVPFCPFLCHFCPLYKVTKSSERTDESKARFVEALIGEIELYGRTPAATGKIYDSVYFGGGTPTELTPPQLCSILRALRRNFNLAPGAEITLEGVARQMSIEGYLEPCVEAGFNRFSFGVQSLEERLRKRIGRGDGVDDYLRTVQTIKGLMPTSAVNVEIMAGLPEQTMESFSADVAALAAWPIDSVDILYYVLMPGTRLQQLVGDGHRDGPRYGSSLLRMRRFVNAELAAAGFNQLTGEVFSRSDRDLFTRASYGGGGNCLNTVLALGPSAFGLMGGTGYHNVSSLRLYLSAVEQQLFPVRAAMSLDARHARTRAWAFSIMRLQVPEFLVETRQERRRIQRWRELGLVERAPGGWQLTSHGRAWYNHMQMDALPMAERLAAARMFGSAADQRRMFDQPAEDTLDYELRETVTGGRNVLSGVRGLAYRALLAARSRRASSAPALAFTGESVESPEARSPQAS